MPANEADASWLGAAARLGMRARPLSRPNPAVGAIIVKQGIVAGRGWTQAGGRPHAEAMALDQAGERAKGATAYVSLEPCAHQSKRGPSCADLLAEAGIVRLVAALRDPDPRTAGAGIARLCKAGIDAEIVENTAARQSLAGYLTRATLGRPFVTLKLAFSADGRISTGDRSNIWITGEAARSHVHTRRAQQDAILVGGGTWREDKPRLDVRLPGLEARSPQRFVLTRGEAPQGVQAIHSPQDIAQMDDAQYLYVEGGAQTAASFLDSGLVDCIHIYRAPVEIGGGVDIENELGLAKLCEGGRGWKLIEQCQLGSDQFAAYQRSGS